MNPIEKIQLSKERIALIGQLKANELGAAAKIKASRRIQEIVTLLGGTNQKPSDVVLTAEGADKFHEDLKTALGQVDLSPFERIVKNNEITIETLTGAISSTKQLLDSTMNPPIFIEAIQVVSSRLSDGTLFDSLGEAGKQLADELGAMLDTSYTDEETQAVFEQLKKAFFASGWWIDEDNGVLETKDVPYSFNLVNQGYTFKVEAHFGGEIHSSITSNGISEPLEVFHFVNDLIEHDENKLPMPTRYYTQGDAYEAAKRAFVDSALLDGLDWSNPKEMQDYIFRDFATPSGLMTKHEFKTKVEERLQRMAARKNGEKSLIDHQAQAAATSVLNDAQPSQADLENNAYQPATIDIAGIRIAIENPIGSVRRGTDPDGTEWETTMKAHYGYIEGTKGADGDEIDVFVTEGTDQDFAGRVFIIYQIGKDGEFDEHKVILGVVSKVTAEQVYQQHYDENFVGMAVIKELSIDDFKEWLKNPDDGMFDSIGAVMLDTWLSDGHFELVPIKKLNLQYLKELKEPKATVKDPIVIFKKGSRLHVVHGNSRLALAAEMKDSFVPAIVLDEAEGFSLQLIQQAISKCGSTVHAESLAAISEKIAEQNAVANL